MFFLLAVHREVVYFVYLCVLSLSLPDVSVSLSSVLAVDAKRFAFSSLTRTSTENNVRPLPFRLFVKKKKKKSSTCLLKKYIYIKKMKRPAGGVDL